VLPRVSETNVSVKVRRREREERTKTYETKKREKNFGWGDELSVILREKKRKWGEKEKR
jgi:hypothetical protein